MQCQRLIGLYGLLRCYVDTHPVIDDTGGKRIQSFHLLCRILDLIVLAKRGEMPAKTAAAELKSVTSKHLELYVSIYSADAVKPKHHWQLDWPSFLERDGQVLDMFIIERLHLRVKRWLVICTSASGQTKGDFVE